jgi:hypothetical protein
VCQKWKLIGPDILCFIQHVVNSAKVEGVRKCASIAALLPAYGKNRKVSGVPDIQRRYAIRAVRNYTCNLVNNLTHIITQNKIFFDREC